MSPEAPGSNYKADRSTDFKHQVSGDWAAPSAPTVQDYVYSERCKQMSKLRDWHLEAKDARTTDTVSLRANFVISRNSESSNLAREINHHKYFLAGGAFIAAIMGGMMLLVHF